MLQASDSNTITGRPINFAKTSLSTMQKQVPINYIHNGRIFCSPLKQNLFDSLEKTMLHHNRLDRVSKYNTLDTLEEQMISLMIVNDTIYLNLPLSDPHSLGGEE